MGYPRMNHKYEQTRYNVTPCADRRANRSVRYIAVHYTATEAGAADNCRYFGGGDRQASADYFVDRDGGICKFNGNCARFFTWHVGDGRGRYGITNANSIGIEVVSSGSEFTGAQRESLRALVTAIMDDYGVPASRVVRHHDASRKICPKPYCGTRARDAKWRELHAYITGGKAPSKPAKPSKPGKLAVDGYWGEGTTRALQRAMGTVEDGVVSSQDRHWRDRNPGLTTGWGWTSKPKGSPVIRAMQRKMGLKADGLIGPATVNALIRSYRKDSGATVEDGRLDAASATVKAMQRALNAGRF